MSNTLFWMLSHGGSSLLVKKAYEAKWSGSESHQLNGVSAISYALLTFSVGLFFIKQLIMTYLMSYQQKGSSELISNQAAEQAIADEITDSSIEKEIQVFISDCITRKLGARSICIVNSNIFSCIMKFLSPSIDSTDPDQNRFTVARALKQAQKIADDNRFSHYQCSRYSGVLRKNKSGVELSLRFLFYTSRPLPLPTKDKNISESEKKYDLLVANPFAINKKLVALFSISMWVQIIIDAVRFWNRHRHHVCIYHQKYESWKGYCGLSKHSIDDDMHKVNQGPNSDSVAEDVFFVISIIMLGVFLSTGFFFEFDCCFEVVEKRARGDFNQFDGALFYLRKKAFPDPPLRSFFSGSLSSTCNDCRSQVGSDDGQNRREYSQPLLDNAV